MAAESAQFAIDMKDQLSGPAGQAASSLDKLKSKLQEQQAELRALASAQKVMQGGSSVNVAEFKKLQDRMKGVKESMASNQQAFMKAGGSLTDLAKKSVQHKEKVKEQGEGVRGLIGHLDKWGVTSEKASNSENLAMIGAAGMASAVLALEAALVAGTIALVVFAIKAADAIRTMVLMRVGFAGGAENAQNLGLWIDQLSRKLPQTRAELQEIAKALAGQGLQGNALVTATKAVATTGAAMGQGAAGKIQGIIAQAQTARRLVLGLYDLQGTGINIDDIAKQLAVQMKTTADVAKKALMTGGVDLKTGLDAMSGALDAKFGGTISKLMTSLPTLADKAKENLGQLFSGVNVEPLLNGLASIVHMLDQNTVTGKLLKETLTGIVQPIVNGLTKAGPTIKSVMIGIAMGIVMVEIIAVKLHTALKKLIPPSLRPDFSSTNTAMMVAVGVAGALVAVIGLVAIAMAVALAPVVMLGLGIYLAYLTIKSVVKNIGKALSVIGDAASGAVDAISGFAKDMVKAGEDFIDGLVEGIKNGAIKVIDAAKGVATGAIKAVKSTLHIGSPSRVMRELGSYTAEGFEQGMNARAPKVEGAIASLVAAPCASDARSSGAAAGAAASSGRSVSFTIQELNIYDAGNVDDPAFDRKLVASLRRVATSVALAPMGAGAG